MVVMDIVKLGYFRLADPHPTQSSMIHQALGGS
jgi:hypothetical protein